MPAKSTAKLNGGVSQSQPVTLIARDQSSKPQGNHVMVACVVADGKPRPFRVRQVVENGVSYCHGANQRPGSLPVVCLRLHKRLRHDTRLYPPPAHHWYVTYYYCARIMTTIRLPTRNRAMLPPSDVCPATVVKSLVVARQYRKHLWQRCSLLVSLINHQRGTPNYTTIILSWSYRVQA